VSARVEDVPEIAELDMDPVFVRRHGVDVADCASASICDGACPGPGRSGSAP